MAVLVFADTHEGAIKKSALEAVTYGKKVADKIGTNTAVVAIGKIQEDALKQLGKYGTAEVLHVNAESFHTFEDELYAKAIVKAAEKVNAKVLIFAYDNIGKSLASRVAAGYEAGLVSSVINLPETDKGFVVRKNVFSGKGLADIEIMADKKVLGVTPNTIALETNETDTKISVFDPEINTERRVKVLDTQLLKGDIPLPEAEIVVSGGRGLKDPKNWHLIENLAKALGAATACSRPVSDSGWRPHHEHVGQTGLTIKPNLYVAVGISGAIQHLAGVNQSKTIVVINNDAEAPFYKAADYGIVGDAFEILPKLTDAIIKFKATNN